MPKSRKMPVVAVSLGDVSKKSKGRKKDLLAQWWQERLSKKNLIHEYDSEQASAPAPPPTVSPIAVSPIAASPRAESLLERTIAALASGHAPGKLKRNTPSAINPIPSRYQGIVMPEQYMQKPSYKTIDEARIVSRSLEEQTHLASLQVGQMQRLTSSLGLQAQIAPDINEIIKKIRTIDSTYWARTTDISEEQIRGIIKWIQRKIQNHITHNGPHIIYLIIDFQNVSGCLRDLIGPTTVSETMMEIADILCYLVQFLHSEHGVPIGIILCAHNNTLNKNPDFYNLINELNRCTGLTGFSGDIIVLPTHNRGQLDDYLLVVVGEILNEYRMLQEALYSTSYFIVTSDRLRDMTGISSQLSRIISIDDVLFRYYDIFIPSGLNEEDKREHIRLFKEQLKQANARGELNPYIELRRAIDASSWQSTPYTGGKQGRTIKYKKSLLNKRTRKIYTKNYSQKMKKYSKNKKNKTLRRKRAP
jgi:hypothetical protein